jgi:hypothetical protein
MCKSDRRQKFPWKLKNLFAVQHIVHCPSQRERSKRLYPKNRISNMPAEYYVVDGRLNQ